MEKASVSLEMDNQKDEESLCISEYKSNKLLGGKSRRRLILNFKQLETHENLVQELFRRSLGRRVSKPLMTVDEKYLRHCLEVIHISSSKATACGISSNPLGSGLIFDSSSSHEIWGRDSFELDKIVTGGAMAIGSEDMVISPVGRWIVGSVMRSNSMVNILKSPLLQQLGNLDGHVKFGGASSAQHESLIRSEFNGSLNHGKGMLLPGNHGDRSDAVRRGMGSGSCAPSMFADQFAVSSSPFGSSNSQGMLRCVWNHGVPHFTFSVDDQKELYVADAWKIDSPGDKVLDFVYLFHLRPDGQKENEAPAIASDIVGKMRVSTSFSLSSNNSKVQETEFVLLGLHEHVGEVRTSARAARKTRKLSKVMEVLKAGHSAKHRSPSKFSSADVSCEIFPSDEHQDNRSGAGLLESDLPPNLELAAIVVKDHLHEDDSCEDKVGGWGLKFLKKARVQPSLSSESCQRNIGDCSTSMHIILPAGVHGGPSTRIGGPSSLIERWRSGGQCDCGGWDVGCPLTILNPALRKGGSMHSEAQGECKSFDIYTQGSKQGAPTVKMVNIHDDAYFINFQPTLSALQCFSIAVAIVHSRSPSLRPKHAHY